MNSFNNSNFCPLLREGYKSRTPREFCTEKRKGYITMAEGMELCVNVQGLDKDDNNIFRSHEKSGRKGHDYVCTGKLNNGTCFSSKVHVTKRKMDDETTVLFTNDGEMPVEVQTSTQEGRTVAVNLSKP